MLQTAFVVVLLVIKIVYINGTGFQNLQGLKTDDYPKSSCLEITKIKDTLACKCGILIDKIIMMSYEKYTHICMCCVYITGSDIIGQIGKHIFLVSNTISTEQFVYMKNI